MKRHALFVALLCFSSLWIATSKLNALTIPASEDSYTAPRNTLSYSTNNANSLIVDATRKSYLYFDLSDIPADAVVRWAKLRLFLPTVRTPGAGLSVHLVTGTWNESTRLADVPSIVAGSLGVIPSSKMASRRFVTVDVKDTVQKWINGGTLNEGFAIQPIVKAGSPTASVMLTSKEGPVFGLPAELDIEFGPTFDTLPLSIRSYFGPTITTQPSAASSGGGSLTVTASGMGPLTYQWMLNGVPIAGATSTQLPAQGLESGTYTVVVSNPFTTVTSVGVQYTPSPIGTLALVAGGTLPASSPLGAVPVSTFYMGKTEVTWGEWQTVRAWAVANGYTDLANVGEGLGDNHPVSEVNWYDAVKWCNARSEKEGKVPVYKVGSSVYRTGQLTPDAIPSANGYRLPSEAEWEFAARGGTRTQGYKYSGSNELDTVGWFYDNANNTTHEVGKKQANELGIYDMSGSLCEWTGSWYQNAQYGHRAFRGGGLRTSDSLVPLTQVHYEVALRFSGFPSFRHYDFKYGFRVALSSVPEMVLVRGGTLPASSELGALPVDTFYIGRTEVTWGEWKAVRTWAVANGYTDLANVGTGIADTYPVSDVNWYDVVKWCNARSEKEGKTPVYKNGTNVYRNGNVSEPAIVASANGYRLPSEKEWEFAARGGTQTNGYTYSGSNDLSEVGWYRANYGSLENSDSVHEVGKKLANELGIYDMSGNLWEWCASWHPSYVGVSRIIRGGFWHWHDGYAEFCTVAYRGNRNPETRNGYDGGGKSFGFRVAINATPQMVLIPGGQFEMGDPLDNDLDAPVHTVNLSPFYMGEAEVTYREWTAVKGWAQNHGYSFSHQGWGQNDLDPVICGNFYDVLKWINAKSELDGLIPCYYKDDGLISVYRSGEIDINNSKVNWSASGYRLPTEAEWEGAARGGKIGKRYPWGDSINTSLANYSESERYISIELGQTSVYRSVKSYPPNDYGLYDMTGNAWEWCWDRYGSYGASELANPKGPDVGDQRVVRGGDWDSSPQLCRVARRSKCLLNYDLYNHGFRLVKQ